MDNAKRELLTGCARITEFDDKDYCYVLVPKLEQGSIMLNTNQRQNMSSISLRLDRLLGKWLKIKKYFDIPVGQQLCSLLFLQPIWKNSIVNVVYNNGTPYDGISGNLRPEFILDDYLVWKKSNNIIQSWGGSNHHWFYAHISIQLPFLFVELSPNDFELFESDIRCPRLDYKLIRTSDPTIYLLAFSRLLPTDKDCAKLLRQFLKNPTNPIWSIYDTYEIPLYLAKPVTIRALWVKGVISLKSAQDLICDNTNDDLLSRVYNDSLENLCRSKRHEIEIT